MNFRIPDTRPRRIQHLVCSTVKVISDLTQGESRSHEDLPYIDVPNLKERSQARVPRPDRPPPRRHQHHCWVNRQQQRRILPAALLQHLR